MQYNVIYKKKVIKSNECFEILCQILANQKIDF